MDCVKQCVNLIDKMSTDDFHQKIVKGVMASDAFSKLMSFGIRKLTSVEKNKLYEAMQTVGLPLYDRASKDADENLELVALYLAQRAFSVR